MEIGPLLRKLRRKLDLTQENISLEVGLCQKQISLIESGVAQPRVDKLELWCKALGFTMVKLFKMRDRLRKKQQRVHRP